MSTSLQILKQYWGYDNFRSPQDKIVDAAIAGKNVLALLPTGGGKSVCFQVPALAMEGICLVVTPLIALMEDQVSQLKRRGISAIAIHSGLKRAQLDIALDNCVYGKIKFLYLSPERIQTEMFKVRVEKMNVSVIAVDEAHCISQWGYDFRPSYLQIAELREIKPDAVVIALTATATKEVKSDILQHLNIPEAEIFQKSFARDNLSFVVRKGENKEKRLLDILRKVPGSAIVYLRSRKGTERLAKWLTKNGISAGYYHAGLDHATRSQKQEEWIANRTRVIAATNAFGMGIDKPDVRSVIHLDLPETMEAYYQEAGRAGRDGKRSYAVIIYTDQDVADLKNKVLQSQPSLDYLKKIYQALANYYHIALGSSQGESFEFDLVDFSSRFNLKPLPVFSALKKLEESGLIEFNESFYKPSRINIAVDKGRLYEFQVANEKFDPVIKTLLRLYGAELFSDFVTISEKQIAGALKVGDSEARSILAQLNKLQIFQYEPASDSPRITFIVPRQDADRLPIDKQKMEERRNLIIGKMELMEKYTTQVHQCRMQIIQEYFDEETFSVCGVCDVCIAKKKKENRAAIVDYHDQILVLLDRKPMTSEDLELAINPDDHELFVEIIREMLDDEEIKYDEFWVLKKI